MDEKKVLDLFAEIGMLKRVKRSGWWMLGVPYDESVAEHSFRCAAIGYVIARMENADALKVLLMCLFNDLHEARINDQHKVAHRYLNVREAEKNAFNEQMDALGGEVSAEMKDLRKEHDVQESRESRIARDADILECLIQAKEYVDLGYDHARKFFRKAPDHLVTDSARKIWNAVPDWESDTWWERLSSFER